MRIISPRISLQGSVALPTSKSISNRILVLRHLSKIPLEIRNLSDADDTAILAARLSEIKKITGSGIPDKVHLVDAGMAGTAFRFLAAVLANAPGTWILSGSERMLERPVAPLVDALRTLGADISYRSIAGYPPLLIRGTELKLSDIAIQSSESSQFASALLMLAAASKSPVRITLEGETVSLPYIDMTVAVMRSIGMEVNRTGSLIEVNDTKIRAGSFDVEADWSSAAFFYELCALNPGCEIRIPDLREFSIQGDRSLVPMFEQLGISTTFHPEGAVITNVAVSTPKHLEMNLKDTPDLVPALACTCAALGIKANLRGLGHLRIKESDRLAALAQELSSLGCSARARESSLHLAGKITRQSRPLKTYADHRLAMAFAPLATHLGALEIDDPEVVSKSFPRFWDEFSRITGSSLISEQSPR